MLFLQNNTQDMAVLQVFRLLNSMWLEAKLDCLVSKPPAL